MKPRGVSPSQEAWLEHLSDSDYVVIKPFDSTAQAKFEQVRELIQGRLGQQTPVEHHGATSLGISGQDEIDIYVPVPEDRFNAFIEKLSQVFGEPRSHYSLERARFRTEVEGKRIDVFLINSESNGWLDCLKFEAYLREHPESLRAYERMKEEGHGLSTQQYYRRKTDFVNRILDLSDTCDASDQSDLTDESDNP